MKEGRLYQDRDWLYKKYVIEELSTIKIGKICNVTNGTIGRNLKKYNIKTRYNDWLFRSNIKPFYKDKKWLYQKFLVEKKSTKEIGNICNVSYKLICKYLKDNGIAKEKPVYFNKDWLKQKYIIERLSSQQIADISNIDRKSIDWHLKKHGIKKRTKSDCAKMMWNNEESRNRLLESRRSPQYRKRISKRIKVLWKNPKYRQKMCESLKIVRNNPEAKKKQSEMQKKLWQNVEYKKKMIKLLKIAQNRPEAKKKRSESMKIAWNRFGFKKKMSKISKRQWTNLEYREKTIEMSNIIRNNPEYRKKMSKIAKRRWESPEYREKAFKFFQRRPTKPEYILDNITPSYIFYVGNGKKWISFKDNTHKNPDFKIVGQNKVIEVFGDYWHKDDDPYELIFEYRKIGYDCLVIWEYEIYNDIDNVLERINKFIS